MDVVGWSPFAAGNSIGKIGSENGVIVADEEYGAGARITLERVGYPPYSITCGIYGWMAHTRFFATEQEAIEAFAAMKVELARIVNLIPVRDDPQASTRAHEAEAQIHAFIEDFR
jgi:hypothetical protein